MDYFRAHLLYYIYSALISFICRLLMLFWSIHLCFSPNLVSSVSDHVRVAQSIEAVEAKFCQSFCLSCMSERWAPYSVGFARCEPFSFFLLFVSLFVRFGARENVVGLLTGCLMSQQHASVSQGWICLDNFVCCHTEIEVADPTFYLTQSQYTDTRPTSPLTTRPMRRS